MRYRKFGATDVELSLSGWVAMSSCPTANTRLQRTGGRASGRRAGTNHPGFGGPRRKEIIKLAYDHGINFFDVTVDSEKEALGRNLKELPPPYEFSSRPDPKAWSTPTTSTIGRWPTTPCSRRRCSGA